MLLCHNRFTPNYLNLIQYLHSHPTQYAQGLQLMAARCGYTLKWRHNGCDGVSNHQPHHCLLNRLFGLRSTKTSKLRLTGFCARNSPVIGEFPAQMASNAENISIWWRHHVLPISFGITSLLLRWSYFCSSDSEAILTNMYRYIAYIFCKHSVTKPSHNTLVCTFQGSSSF